MSFTELFEARFHKPHDIDFYTAFRGLQLLLASGATLQQALLDLADDQENAQLGKAMRNVARNLSAGMSPSLAFNKEPVFSPLMSATVEAGDKSGNLGAAFLRLSELMYLRHNLYSKINNVLFVPKLSAALMTFLTIAYIKFVIPEYVKLYAENGFEIPIVISIATGLVNFIVDNWYITILGGYFLCKFFGTLISANETLIDSLRLKMPVYNKLHFYFLQHQFASIVELMLSSGLNIPQALEQASKSADNSIMRRDILRVQKHVLLGNSLSASMRKNNTNKVFDKLLVASLKSGELSNQMVPVLRDECDYYSRTLNNLIEPTGTKITFLVMIPMGVMIVGMFMFTLVPMFSYITKMSG